MTWELQSRHAIGSITSNPSIRDASQNVPHKILYKVAFALFAERRKPNGTHFVSGKALLVPKTGSSFRFQARQIAVRPPWPLALGEGA